MSSIVCIGAVLIDEIFYCDEKMNAFTSNPAIYKKNIGGVMGNVVRNLSLLDVDTTFITVFGNDAEARFITEKLAESGVSLSHSYYANAATGKYVAIHEPNGQLNTAVCTDTLSHYITSDFLRTKKDVLKSATFIIADANLELNTLQWLDEFAFNEKIKLIIEPVSVIKARKLKELDFKGVFMITPNELELNEILKTDDWSQHSKELINKGLKLLWISLGKNGSILIDLHSEIRVGVPDIVIKDSTGAGDAALAAWIFAYLNHYNATECIKIAQSMAMEILQTDGTVDEKMTKEKLLHSYRNYYNEEA